MIDLKDIAKVASAATGKDLTKMADAANIANMVKDLDKDVVSKLGITPKNATDIFAKIIDKDSAIMKIVNALSADQKKQIEKIVKQLLKK